MGCTVWKQTRYQAASTRYIAGILLKRANQRTGVHVRTLARCRSGYLYEAVIDVTILR